MAGVRLSQCHKSEMVADTRDSDTIVWGVVGRPEIVCLALPPAHSDTYYFVGTGCLLSSVELYSRDLCSIL